MSSNSKIPHSVFFHRPSSRTTIKMSAPPQFQAVNGAPAPQNQPVSQGPDGSGAAEFPLAQQLDQNQAAQVGSPPPYSPPRPNPQLQPPIPDFAVILLYPRGLYPSVQVANDNLLWRSNTGSLRSIPVYIQIPHPKIGFMHLGTELRLPVRDHQGVVTLVTKLHFGLAGPNQNDRPWSERIFSSC
jgi:hypothetical protein